MRRVTVEIIADPSRFIAGSRMAREEASGLNHSMTKIGRGALAGTVSLSGFGRAIAFASAQFLGGFGLAFALSKSAEAAIKFDAEMMRLSTQAGVSKSAIKGLSTQILSMATKVNTGPEDLAKALYHIESSGFHGAVAMKMLTESAKQAKIGHADLEQVASALAAAFRTEGHAAESTRNQLRDVTTTASELNAIIGVGNVRLSELAKAISTGVLPSGRAFGVGLRDIGAAMDVLTHAGVPAQLAGTRLRTTLSFLGGQGAPTTKALKEIGLSASDLAKTIRTQGLLPGLIMLQEHLSKLGKTDQARIITKAFGAARSSTTIITLLQNLDQLQQNLQNIDRIAGHYKNSWKGYLETAAASTDRLSASMKVMEITVGQALEPTITSVANGLAKWLQSSQHQKEVQQYVAKSVNAVVFAVRSLIKEVQLLAAPFGGVIRLAQILIGLKLGSVIYSWGRGVYASAKALRELGQAQKVVGDTAVTMAAKEKVAAGAIAATTVQSEAAGAAAAGAATASTVAAEERATSTMMSPSGLPMYVSPRTGWGQKAPLVYPLPRALPFTQYNTSPLRARAPGLGLGDAVYAPMLAGGKIAAGEAAAKEAALASAKIGVFRVALARATGALGNFGFYGIIAATTITMGYMLLKLTGVNDQLGKLGHWLSKVPGPQPRTLTPKEKITTEQFMRDAAAQVKSNSDFKDGFRVGFSALNFRQPTLPTQTPPAPMNTAPAPFNTAPASISTMPRSNQSKAVQSMVPGLELEFKINHAQAVQMVKDFLKKLQHEADINKLVIKAVVQKGGGDVLNPNTRGDHPFVMPRINVGAIPALDELDKLNQAYAEAQLALSRGDKGANERIIAILRERIAFDAKYAKIQESLIKTDAKNAAAHSKSVTKLLQEEAQAYADLNNALKETFSIPIKLQIAQIQAGVTAKAGDDVAVAKQVAALALKAIHSGKLSGDNLTQAWQEWASAMSTINDKQKKAIEVPMGLQIAQAEAALTASTVDDEKVALRIRSWARKQLKAAKGADRLSLLQIIRDTMDSVNNSLTLPYKLQLAQAKAALTSSTMDDARVERQIYDYWKKVAAQQKKMHNKIGYLTALQNEGQAFSDLNKGGSMTSYEMTSSHMLTAGLGLSRSQRIAEEQRIAQSEAHGGRRPKAGAVGALGTPVTVYVTIDGDYIKKQKVTRTLQAERGRTSPQRRGRHGGHGLGID